MDTRCKLHGLLFTKPLIAEVIATYGRHLLLRDAAGVRRMARPMGRHLEIVCGDRVQCRSEGEELLAESILPRDSFLRRSTLRGRSEPLAANLTQLAVIVAPMPLPDLFLIDRYLSAAASAPMSVTVCRSVNSIISRDGGMPASALRRARRSSASGTSRTSRG